MLAHSPIAGAPIAAQYRSVTSVTPPAGGSDIRPVSAIHSSRTVDFGGGTNRVDFNGGTNRVDFI